MKVGKVVVATALALTVGTTTAKDVEYLQKGANRLTITDEPCTNPKVVEWVLRLGVGPYLPMMKRAKGLWQGKHIEACVFETDGVYAVVDEAGDSGYLAKRDFKPMSARFI